MYDPNDCELQLARLKEKRDAALSACHTIHGKLEGVARGEAVTGEAIREAFVAASEGIVNSCDSTSVVMGQPKRKLICDQCGEVEFALIDGYDFGDRLLEGVKFEVRLNPTLHVQVAEKAKPYFSQLNEKMWLDRAIKHAQWALAEDILTCPKCGEGSVVDESRA